MRNRQAKRLKRFQKTFFHIAEGGSLFSSSNLSACFCLAVFVWLFLSGCFCLAVFVWLFIGRDIAVKCLVG